MVILLESFNNEECIIHNDDKVEFQYCYHHELIIHHYA